VDTETPEYRERPTRSQLSNVERGNPDEVLLGKLTARKAEHLSGKGTSEKRRPAAERQRESESKLWYNLPDRASA
jgi:hypothetical protein